jgi:hypothetical protein
MKHVPLPPDAGDPSSPAPAPASVQPLRFASFEALVAACPQPLRSTLTEPGLWSPAERRTFEVTCLALANAATRIEADRWTALEQAAHAAVEEERYRKGAAAAIRRLRKQALNGLLKDAGASQQEADDLSDAWTSGMAGADTLAEIEAHLAMLGLDLAFVEQEATSLALGTIERFNALQRPTRAYLGKLLKELDIRDARWRAELAAFAASPPPPPPTGAPAGRCTAPEPSPSEGPAAPSVREAEPSPAASEPMPAMGATPGEGGTGQEEPAGATMRLGLDGKAPPAPPVGEERKLAPAEEEDDEAARGPGTFVASDGLRPVTAGNSTSVLASLGAQRTGLGGAQRAPLSGGQPADPGRDQAPDAGDSRAGEAPGSQPGRPGGGHGG